MHIVEPTNHSSYPPTLAGGRTFMKFATLGEGGGKKISKMLVGYTKLGGRVLNGGVVHYHYDQ